MIQSLPDVVTTICYSPYAGSAITIDHENIIKAYSVAPSMLGRGHTLLELNGPIWVRLQSSEDKLCGAYEIHRA